MFELDAHPSGRHFLQIPGPTNVPDRVLRAMDRPVIDHRGPEFAALTGEVFEGMQSIFQTSSRVVIFPSSGTGAVEAALAGDGAGGVALEAPPIARRSASAWSQSFFCR